MVLSTVITKIGLPVLMSVVAGGLSKIDSPVAQSAARALGNVDEAFAGGIISAEQMAEANRHAEAMAQIKAKEYEGALSEVNQTIRAEASSSDAYVRRMRPTFGYLLAGTWALQMTGLAYIMTFQSEKAPAILDSMDALSTIWAVGLSVLGIYVYKRSEEKKAVMTTHSPPAQSAPAKKPSPPRKPAYNE